jgi:hypothetical protein
MALMNDNDPTFWPRPSQTAWKLPRNAKTVLSLLNPNVAFSIAVGMLYFVFLGGFFWE